MCENCKHALRDQISDIVCNNHKSLYYQQYIDNVKECSKFEEIKRGTENIFGNTIIH